MGKGKIRSGGTIQVIGQRSNPNDGVPRIGRGFQRPPRAADSGVNIDSGNAWLSRHPDFDSLTR